MAYGKDVKIRIEELENLPAIREKAKKQFRDQKLGNQLFDENTNKLLFLDLFRMPFYK